MLSFFSIETCIVIIHIFYIFHLLTFNSALLTYMGFVEIDSGIVTDSDSMGKQRTKNLSLCCHYIQTLCCIGFGKMIDSLLRSTPIKVDGCEHAMTGLRVLVFDPESVIKFSRVREK